MAVSPQFITLVYPEVLRRLLTRALVEADPWSEDDEEEGWQGDWVRFARGLGGLGPVPPPGQREPREQWIEEAVAQFARRHQLRGVWNLSHEQEHQR